MGVTHHGLLQLQQRFYVMIRQLLRDHAYRTGRTHSEALQTHNIPEPLQLLWHISERLLQSATQRYMQLDSTDIARTVSWTQIVAAQESIRSLQMSGTPSGLCAESAQDQVHEPSFFTAARCAISSQ